MLDHVPEISVARSREEIRITETQEIPPLSPIAVAARTAHRRIHRGTGSCVTDGNDRAHVDRVSRLPRANERCESIDFCGIEGSTACFPPCSHGRSRSTVFDRYPQELVRSKAEEVSVGERIRVIGDVALTRSAVADRTKALVQSSPVDGGTGFIR
jgi:hypothetical protein